MGAAVEKMPEQASAPTVVATDAGALMQMIGRIAQDPTVDLDRFERLIAMQERMQARQAEQAYTLALSEMQPQLPVVDQKGCILVMKKDKPNEVQQSTPYARWEDINEAIRPVLSEHGFSLSFRGNKEGDRVVVTAILGHKDGHKETTTLSLPVDGSGSKNAVQSVGSSLAYGKRYTAGLLLNLTSRAKNEADDDGNAACAPPSKPVISADQVEQIKKALAFRDVPIERALKAFKVESLDEIYAIDFDACLRIAQGQR